MVIDEQKIQCITYLIKGMPITDISKLLNCSRQSIYTWLGDDGFKAELDKRRQDLLLQGNNMILSDLDTYINKIKLLATKAKSEKVQLEASQYLLDRMYGRPSTKTEVTDAREDKTHLEDDILSRELEEFKAESEDSEEISNA